MKNLDSQVKKLTNSFNERAQNMFLRKHIFPRGSLNTAIQM